MIALTLLVAVVVVVVVVAVVVVVVETSCNSKDCSQVKICASGILEILMFNFGTFFVLQVKFHRRLVVRF